MKSIFYTVYKITNILNEMIYIGYHKSFNPNDNYMGSGKELRKAIKLYGVENFKKDILSFHDTLEEMMLEERRLVNREFIERSDTYNLIEGGGGNTIDTVLVVNDSGKRFRVPRNDPDYLSGKLVAHGKGMIMLKDSNGKNYRMLRNDPRIKALNLKPMFKDKTLVYDEHGEKKWVNVNDPKFLDGTYIHITKNRIVSEETKMKQKKVILEKGLNKGDKNSMFGKCFVHNNEIMKSKAIYKKDLDEYEKNGWLKGRLKTNSPQKNHVWIKNDSLELTTTIPKDEIIFKLDEGWTLGRNLKYAHLKYKKG